MVARDCAHRKVPRADHRDVAYEVDGKLILRLSAMPSSPPRDEETGVQIVYSRRLVCCLDGCKVSSGDLEGHKAEYPQFVRKQGNIAETRADAYAESRIDLFIEHFNRSANRRFCRSFSSVGSSEQIDVKIYNVDGSLHTEFGAPFKRVV